MKKTFGTLTEHIKQQNRSVRNRDIAFHKKKNVFPFHYEKGVSLAHMIKTRNQIENERK